MNSQVVFIVEVILVSAFLSAVVKYGGALLPLTANAMNAMLIILIPVVLVAIVLWWRAQYLDSLESGK